jgi:hypothetical protein
MAYDALKPLATAPANVVTIAAKGVAAADVLAAAAKCPAGTFIYTVAESNLYICLPNYAVAGFPITAWEVAAAIAIAT